jgi:hypothetical protein
VPYEVDLTAEGFPAAFQQLQPWARESLEQALVAASLDPHLLPDLPTASPNARILTFAGGDGLCLVKLDDEAKTMTVRIMQAPR